MPIIPPRSPLCCWSSLLTSPVPETPAKSTMLLLTSPPATPAPSTPPAPAAPPVPPCKPPKLSALYAASARVAAAAAATFLVGVRDRLVAVEVRLKLKALVGVYEAREDAKEGGVEREEGITGPSGVAEAVVVAVLVMWMEGGWGGLMAVVLTVCRRGGGLEKDAPTEGRRKERGGG
ncbi:unnamed protein product [Closterium sp. NIES-53]